MSEPSFAETAREAWPVPRGPRAHARAFGRRELLRLASLRAARPAPAHVRCIFSHAVFPEHRGAFRTFIRELRSQAEFIDTRTLIAFMRSGEPPHDRFYHLSFDDGLANIAEVAAEVLADEGLPYTIFLPTDLVGASWETLEHFNRTRLRYRRPVRTMSWQQVRACVAGGAEIGCHTATHPRLSEISADPAALDREIAAAKRRIEAETARPCVAFAWPFGRDADIDEISRAAIANAGFEICFSAIRGGVMPGRPLTRVPRQQVEFHWPAWENRLWANGYRD